MFNWWSKLQLTDSKHRARCNSQEHCLISWLQEKCNKAVMCSVHSAHEGIMLDTQREKEEVGGCESDRHCSVFDLRLYIFFLRCHHSYKPLSAAIELWPHAGCSPHHLYAAVTAKLPLIRGVWWVQHVHRMCRTRRYLPRGIRAELIFRKCVNLSFG